MNKKLKTFLIIFSILCSITLVYSIYNIIVWKLDSNKTNNQIEEIQEEIPIIEIEDNDNTEDIPVIDENTFYRVVCGSFNNRVYAEERLEQLKELGIADSFIVIYNKE